MSDEIAEIKERLQIVDYISSHLSLKRRGRNFVACCPFHNEKTPSFNVSPDKQTYYCFGCQRGGDIFAFVMEYENIPFREALEMLAKQAGVTLRKYSANKPDTKERDERWDKAMETTLEFFRENFHAPEGQKARDYIKNRGFTDHTIEKYEVGYAKDSWNALQDYCSRRAIKTEDLLALELIKQNDKGNTFDFFRDRVIFPIRATNGRLVGFGGRVLGDGEPKYLNSPETPIFKKSRLLYNMPIAKEKVRETKCFLLMEGYTDVMMAEQFSLGAATATLGTSLSEEHVQMIKRYTPTIYLLYDGDNAGQKAMERSLPFFVKYGLDARSITLPNGLDPCEFLLQNENWRETWDKLREESLDVFNFKLNRLIKQHEPLRPESIASIADTMIEDLKPCRDPIRLDVYIEQLSKKLGISHSAIDQKINQGKQKRQAPTKQAPARQMPKAVFRKDDGFFLLSLTISNQKFISDLEERMHTLAFPNTVTFKILKKWIDAHQGAEDLALPVFKENLEPEERSIFDEAMIQEIPPPDEQLRMFFEKLDQIRKPEDKSELKKQLSEAIKANDRSEIRKLTQQLQKHR